MRNETHALKITINTGIGYEENKIFWNSKKENNYSDLGLNIVPYVTKGYIEIYIRYFDNQAMRIRAAGDGFFIFIDGTNVFAAYEIQNPIVDFEYGMFQKKLFER